MKKPTVYFFVIGGILLLTVLLLVWVVLGPSGPIIVSKQTTYLTEPLAADGLIDYRQAIVDLQGKDVLPEENAAIPFLQATWPCDLDAEHQVLVCDALQMKVPAADGMEQLYNEELLAKITKRLNDYAETLPNYDPIQFPTGTQNSTDLISETHYAPWTRDQIPELADWLDQQQPHFAKLGEMPSRPKYFLPSPNLLDDSDEYLFAALLPTVQHMRDVSRALATRSMLAIGENRPNDAWEDVKLNFTLSRCCNQPDFLVSHLVCIAIRGVSLETLNVLLASGQCDAALLDEIEQFLAQLKPFDDMTPSINVMERLGGLDAAISITEKKIDADDLLGTGDGMLGSIAYAPFDRNAMLRKLNQWYDRIAMALEIDDLEEREQALEQLEDDIQTETQAAISAGNIAGAIFNQSARGELIAQIVTGLMLPAASQAVYAEERLNLQLQLARVTVALEKYRLEKGDYPDTLAPLESRVDPALLNDPYAAGQLRYEKRPPGFLLYSVARNRIDDGGLSQDGEIVGGEWITGEPVSDYQKGDQIIRFPQPKKSVTDILPWNRPPEDDGDATNALDEEPAAELEEAAEEKPTADETEQPEPVQETDATETPPPAAE